MLFSFLLPILLLGTLNPATENAFLSQCAMTTGNKEACLCALKRLGKKYNEQTLFGLSSGNLSEKERTRVMQDVFETATKCFVQDECSEEISHILGKPLAQKTCACAVERLMKMDDLEQAAFLAVDGNFFAENERRFEEAVMKEIKPCLPKQVTAEIKQNLVDECVKESGNKASIKALCSCVTEEVFKKYTLENFIKETFGNADALDEFITSATRKCKSN